jgi:hypothetical protein
MRHGEGPDAHSSPSAAPLKLEIHVFSKNLELRYYGCVSGEIVD